MVTGPPLLEARGVTARYRRRPVLRGVDLALRPGEIVGISGENGSGMHSAAGTGARRPSAPAEEYGRQDSRHR